MYRFLLFALVALAVALPLIGRADTKDSPKPAVRLVTAKEEETFRKLLPKTNDKDFERVRDLPLIFYTTGADSKSMPQAFQMFGDGLAASMPGIHNISSNPSNDRDEIQRRGPGQANPEFPWRSPGGTDNSPNVGTFKFVHLPEAIKVRYERLWHPFFRQYESNPSVVWTYPDGTVFGEVLYMQAEDGYSHTFEVRMRTKKDGKWDPAVYRPFPKLAQLQAAAAKLVQADSSLLPSDGPLAKGYTDLMAGKPASPPHKGRLTDDSHRTKRAIDVEATEWDLPALPEALVTKLLAETTFQKDFGDSWTNREPYAVTTQARYNIVPKGYAGGYLAVGKGACMKCHEGTLEHAAAFDRDRGWYGRVKGSDGILSFHPFSPDVISTNNRGLGVKWRQELLDASLLVGEK